MSVGATDILYGVGRSAAYILYVVGGVSVACGVVRTACSVGGLVANTSIEDIMAIFSCCAPPPPQKSFLDEIADGATDFARKVERKAKHLVGEQDPKEFWQAQLVRGLVELIPLVGGLYFTYVDNFSESAKLNGYSIYQIGELADGIERELFD